jgi:hypothetical protein
MAFSAEYVNFVRLFANQAYGGVTVFANAGENFAYRGRTYDLQQLLQQAGRRVRLRVNPLMRERKFWSLCPEWFGLGDSASDSNKSAYTLLRRLTADNHYNTHAQIVEDLLSETQGRDVLKIAANEAAARLAKRLRKLRPNEQLLAGALAAQWFKRAIKKVAEGRIPPGTDLEQALQRAVEYAGLEPENASSQIRKLYEELFETDKKIRALATGLDTNQVQYVLDRLAYVLKTQYKVKPATLLEEDAPWLSKFPGTADKEGQPVIALPPEQCILIGHYTRMQVAIFQMALDDHTMFSIAPGLDDKALHAEILRRWALVGDPDQLSHKSLDVTGMDASQTEAAHIFMHECLLACVDDVDLGEEWPFVAQLREVMRAASERWMALGRQHGERGTTMWQLASGLPWTLSLNCTACMMYYSLVFPEYDVMLVQGDDGVVSFKGSIEMDRSWMAVLRTVVKVPETTTGWVEWCSRAWDRHGYYPIVTKYCCKTISAKMPESLSDQDRLARIKETQVAAHDMLKAYDGVESIARGVCYTALTAGCAVEVAMQCLLALQSYAAASALQIMRMQVLTTATQLEVPTVPQTREEFTDTFSHAYGGICGY